MNIERFSKFVRGRRGSLTQTQFAEKLETTQATISAYEVGLYPPPVDGLIRMAEKLGVTSTYLISLLDENYPDEYFNSNLDLPPGLQKEDIGTLALIAKSLSYYRNSDLTRADATLKEARRKAEVENKENFNKQSG